MLKKIVSRLNSTTITVNGKPYLTRYYLFGHDRAWGNIYIHHFHSSDQGIELHSHPWRWGLSIVLSGGYVEERSHNPTIWELDEHGTEIAIGHPVVKHQIHIERRNIKPGTINVIRSTDFHRVDLNDEIKGAWTLFFAGPRTFSWGFLNRNTAEYKDWKSNPEAIP